MDWPLILRSADDMRDIISSAVDMSGYDVDVCYGSNRDIVYARMRKKAP